MRDHEIHEFSNGLRLIYQRHKGSRVVHCGFVLDVGSRDETSNEKGLAHFIEHMLFKGTERRPATRILNRLEVVGGELNAFTTKDKTAVYASIVKEYTSRSLELLTDIVFHSVFPEREIEREKRVIQEEIEMYLDTPEERIFDEFQDYFFKGHALGTNILGDKASLSQFQRAHLQAFIGRNYKWQDMVFSFVGDVPMNRVVKQLEKMLPNEGHLGRRPEREVFQHYTPFHHELSMRFQQAYAIVGFPAYKLSDDRRTTLLLLNNILGGPGLNSKLNLSLREKHACTYDIDSSYMSFSDTGMLSIHWSTDREQLKKSLRLVQKELDQFRLHGLNETQLRKYKTQFKGQVLMGEDNKSSLMVLLGKSLLDLGKVDTLDEVMEQIDAVNARQLYETANELLLPELKSTLIYHPGA